MAEEDIEAKMGVPIAIGIRVKKDKSILISYNRAIILICT